MLLLLPFLTCGAGLLTVTNGLELGDKYTVECDDFPKCSHLRLCADNTDTTRLFKRQSAIRGSVNNLTFTAATLTSTTLSEPAAPQSGQQSYNVQSADGMIQYQLLCTTPSAMTTPSVSDPADFCKNAIAAFALAGDYLSNLLSITVPIQVTGRIHSFCEAPNDGSASITADRCGSILGFAKPAAFFSVSGSPDLPDVLFPQALARQLLALGENRVSGLEPYDIQVEFNSDAIDTFYFGPDVTQSAGTADSGDIGAEQYDFLYIILHEQIHGLGVVSFWDTYLSRLPQGFLPASIDVNSLLLPPLQLDSNQTTIVGVDRTGIYDYFLTSVVGPLSFRWSDQIPAITSWIQAGFNASLNGQIAAYNLYNAAALADSTVFQIIGKPSQTVGPIDQYVTLSSDGTFIGGTSVVHVDQKIYTGTEEFLMRPYASNGVTLKQLSDMYGGPLKPFGRSTAMLLATLGFELSDDAKSNLVGYHAASTRLDNNWMLILCVLTTVMFIEQ